MSIRQERRRYSRAEVEWPVVMLTERGVAIGETTNIGLNGAFISCRAPLPSREKFWLFIMVPNRQPLSLPVEVAWSNPYGSEVDIVPRGIGVRFVEILDDDRVVISTQVLGYLRSAKKLAIGLERSLDDLFEEAIQDLLKKYETNGSET